MKGRYVIGTRLQYRKIVKIVKTHYFLVDRATRDTFLLMRQPSEAACGRHWQGTAGAHLHTGGSRQLAPHGHNQGCRAGAGTGAGLFWVIWSRSCEFATAPEPEPALAPDQNLESM